MKTILRVLIVDDNKAMAEDARREIKDSFEDDDTVVKIAIEHDFDKGYELVRQGTCDLVVLDLRRDASENLPEDRSAGSKVYRNITGARFVPVVFWTALPDHVRDEEMLPLVAVLGKDELDRLPDVIRKAIDSRAVSTMAEIERRVADELRAHMWKELAPHWAEYTNGSDPTAIAPVLISRLARVLDADRERGFTSHPSHRYIYPPAVAWGGPGDVVHEIDKDSWWIVLTPACDFEQKKADRVVVARAELLNQHEKFIAWRENQSSRKWEDLRRILTATQNRFHFLPSFRSIPDLVVDLQHLRSIDVKTREDFTVVASLASPFAEALLAQHSHYSGRVGIPDLDADFLKERLVAGIADISE